MENAICAACGKTISTRERTVGRMHRDCVERLLAAQRRLAR